MKGVEIVLEKRLCRIVSVGEVHFEFITESGSINAVFILRVKEEYNAKGKKWHMCFADLDKSFAQVP